MMQKEEKKLLMLINYMNDDEIDENICFRTTNLILQGHTFYLYYKLNG